MPANAKLLAKNISSVTSNARKAGTMKSNPESVAAVTESSPACQSVNEELDLNEVLPWIEFCAWTSLIITPVIWWLQGPSVSDDQAVVRTGLVVLSAIVAVGIRLWTLFAKRDGMDNSLTNIGEALTQQPSPSNVSQGDGQA
jgi:hypothetical protein